MATYNQDRQYGNNRQWHICSNTVYISSEVSFVLGVWLPFCYVDVYLKWAMFLFLAGRIKERWDLQWPPCQLW